METKIKILLGDEILEIDNKIEDMRNTLIENRRKELLDIGCNSLEADEIALEEFWFLSDDEILEKIKELKVK